MKRLKYSMLWAALLLCGCSATPEELGITPAKWATLTPDARVAAQAGHEKVEKIRSKPMSPVYQGASIQLQVLNGTTWMDAYGRQMLFSPATFVMTPGTCQVVMLQSQNKETYTPLTVCYNGLTVFLDPSAYKPAQAWGTVFIDYTPVWKHGFSYVGLNTTGTARLRDTNLHILALPQVPA